MGWRTLTTDNAKPRRRHIGWRLGQLLCCLLLAVIGLILQGCDSDVADGKLRNELVQKDREAISKILDLGDNYTGAFGVNESKIRNDCTGKVLASEVNRLARQARKAVLDKFKIEEKLLNNVIPLDSAKYFISGPSGFLSKAAFYCKAIQELPDAGTEDREQLLENWTIGTVQLFADALPENKHDFARDKRNKGKLSIRKRNLGLEDMDDETFVRFREISIPIREQCTIGTFRAIKIFAKSGCLVEYYRNISTGDCLEDQEESPPRQTEKQKAEAVTSRPIAELQTNNSEEHDAHGKNLTVTARGQLQRRQERSVQGILALPRDTRKRGFASA